MESESGCIRASVSTPDYQLDQLSEAMEDPDSPFLNRVLLPYCLGSPFKLVVAAAALEEGYSLCLPEGSTEQEEEQPDYDALSFTYFCNGSIQVGDQTFSCHNHSGHGQLDLIQALEDSCNPYFIALGQWLGPEAILSMARRMGFGQPTLLAEGLSGSGRPASLRRGAPKLRSAGPVFLWTGGFDRNAFAGGGNGLRYRKRRNQRHPFSGKRVYR